MGVGVGLGSDVYACTSTGVRGYDYDEYEGQVRAHAGTRERG